MEFVAREGDMMQRSRSFSVCTQGLLVCHKQASSSGLVVHAQHSPSTSLHQDPLLPSCPPSFAELVEKAHATQYPVLRVLVDWRLNHQHEFGRPCLCMCHPLACRWWPRLLQPRSRATTWPSRRMLRWRARTWSRSWR